MNALGRLSQAAIAAAVAGSIGLWVSAAPSAATKAAAGGADGTRFGDYLAARTAQLDHDWRSAGARMRAAWESDRDNPELRRWALVLTLAGGDFPTAVTVAHATPADSGDAPLAKLVLTVDDIAEGRFGPAETRLTSAPAEGADRYLSPLLIAWCEVGKNHKPAALAALKPLEALGGATELQKVQAAMIDEAVGDRGEASQLYAAITTDHASPRALTLAAQFHQRQGELDQARALIEKLDPDGPAGAERVGVLAKLAAKSVPPAVPDARSGAAAALFEIAASLVQESQQEGAVDAELYVQMALHLRPNFPDAQLLLAGIEEHFGRQADAASTLLSVDAGSVLRSTAMREAMVDLMSSGQADDAFKLGHEAVVAHPDDIGLALDYADLLRRKLRFTDAIGVYDAALGHIPQTSGRRGLALFGRGVAYERAHEWPRAEADLQAALLLRPNDPELLNYLAFSWADQGINLDRARIMLESAIQASPDNGAFIDSLGWVMFRQGDFDDAVKQLERAVELDADDATVNDHLGDAYWRAGRQVEARTQWEKAARLTDDKALAEQIRVKLRDGLASPPPRRASAD